jgi:hypothetical protein
MFCTLLAYTLEWRFRLRWFLFVFPSLFALILKNVLIYLKAGFQ